MVLERWPPIDSHASLPKVLEAELGYCTCAFSDALPLLRDFLRLVVERTDGVKDPERFRQASEKIVDLLGANGSTGMRSWFVYALDRAGLVGHSFNLYDVLIMDRGRWLLEGLERFPEPPPIPDEDSEPEASADRPRD
jgi:hypothetical protein